MNLDESIKVFEKYFGGKLTKSPELSKPNDLVDYVNLSIGNVNIDVYYHSTHWGKLNTRSIYVEKDNWNVNPVTIEDYLSPNAEELSKILNGDPSRVNIMELAVNNILDILDKSNGCLRGMPCIDGTERRVEIYKLYSVPEDQIDALKELKSIYSNDIIYPDNYVRRTDDFSYLFSIKVNVLN